MLPNLIKIYIVTLKIIHIIYTNHHKMQITKLLEILANNQLLSKIKI